MKHIQQKNTHKQTIRGMVVPAQWDDRFEVTGILVACHDEREIKIENLENFPNLKELSQKEAIFTGVISKSDNSESILLESYTPINDGEE